MKKLFIMTLMMCLFNCVSYAQLNKDKSPYDVSTPIKKKMDENLSKSDFSKLFPYINPVDWKVGMKFMTEPNKDASSYSKIDLSPYNSKNSYTDKIKQSDYQWKIFTYQGLEVRNVKCPRGTCKRTYLIFDCEDKKYEYEYVGDTTELRNAEIGNTIDKLVYLDEVDSVKEMLVGKILFIKTSQWEKYDEEGIGRYSFDNPKFVAVEITSIGLGSQDGPSRVVFKQLNSETEFYLDIRLSGINKESGVFGFDFDKIFQFDDPKLKYPNISSEIWALIQNGKVRIGMTKQECELSWGKPTNINKTTTENIVSEQWVYYSSYLYFKSGILKTIQN